MTKRSKKSNQSQSIQAWMVSDNLHEEYLFFYILIILVWFLLGLGTLGFELSGYSLKQNLFFNFIWLIVLYIGMALTPCWYRLIFGKHAYLYRATAKAMDKLNSYEERRSWRKMRMTQRGQLPPSKFEVASLIFLFCYLMTDYFFVSAWVKDSILVWQPEWVNACVEWVKTYTNLPPLNENRKFFILSFKTDDILQQIYHSEAEFINSSAGKTLLLYHLWHVMMFLPVVITTVTLWWKPLRWFGIKQIDPRYIKSTSELMRRIIWSIFLFFLMLVGCVVIIRSIDLFALSVVKDGVNHWIEETKLHGIYIFIAISIRFFYGWLVFWHNVVRK